MCSGTKQKSLFTSAKRKTAYSKLLGKDLKQRNVHITCFGKKNEKTKTKKQSNETR